MAMHRQRMPPRMGEMAAILSKSLSARLGRGTHPLWEQEDGRQVRTQELSSEAIPFRPESRTRGDHPQQRAVHVKGRGLRWEGRRDGKEGVRTWITGGESV